MTKLNCSVPWLGRSGRTLPKAGAITFLGLLLLAVGGCDKQEAAWQDAQSADTVAAYEAYREQYADTPQAAEATTRIRSIQAARSWERAQDGNTVQQYRQFIEQFPNTQEATQAQTRMAELERNADWEALRESHDTAALDSFARQHAGYPVGRQALQRVQTLEEEQQREQARLAAERAEAANHTHRVQLAARRSEQGAQDGASLLEQRLAPILGEIALEVEQSGNFYLVRTQPLDEPGARSLCERLRSQTQDCLVVTR